MTMYLMYLRVFSGLVLTEELKSLLSRLIAVVGLLDPVAWIRLRRTSGSRCLDPASLGVDGLGELDVIVVVHWDTLLNFNFKEKERTLELTLTLTMKNNLHLAWGL